MKDITEQLQACLGQHPAARMPFDKLYEGIMNEVALGNVSMQSDGDLELFNYSRISQLEGNWNVFSLISRGLILCPKEKKVVAFCFPKFFNLGEVPYFPQNEPFRVYQKIDGSYLATWFYEGKWHCSTRGSFFSSQALWAEDWMLRNIDQSKLVPGRTYIFEVIYPENRIVVKYNFEGLVMISGFDENGYEFLYEDTQKYAKQLGVRVVEEKYFSSIEEMVEKTKTLPETEEGWVIRFDNGYRLKIKGETYLRLHRIISNCTPLSIWDMLRVCGNVDDVRLQLPEEFAKDLTTLENIFKKKEEDLISEIEKLHEETKELSDKELGLKLPELQKVYSESANFIFPCRKKNFLEEYKKPGKLRDTMYNVFRPASNYLPGWTPCSSMSMFSQQLEEGEE